MQIKIDLVTQNVASESRKKKSRGSARSRMLKMVMPMLSGPEGQQLQQAIENYDNTKVKSIMTKLGQRLESKLSDQKRRKKK